MEQSYTTGTRLSQQADFDDLQIAQSTKQGNVPELQATHEEADTRIILHACHAISSGYKRVVVKGRDTDVILMMIYHLRYLAVLLTCGWPVVLLNSGSAIPLVE